MEAGNYDELVMTIRVMYALGNKPFDLYCDCDGELKVLSSQADFDSLAAGQIVPLIVIE